MPTHCRQSWNMPEHRAATEGTKPSLSLQSSSEARRQSYLQALGDEPSKSISAACC